MLIRWSAVTAAAILLILTYGPVFIFAVSIVNRTGFWEDWAIWPFYVGSAVVSVALAVRNRHHLFEADISRLALAGGAFYSAAAVASTLWSVNPNLTLWRSLVYVGLAFFAIVLAGSPQSDLRDVMTALTSAAVVGSLIVIKAFPGAGIDVNGDWEGLYNNRNSLAPLAGLGVVAGIRGLFADDRYNRHSSNRGYRHSNSGESDHKKDDRHSSSNRHNTKGNRSNNSGDGDRNEDNGQSRNGVQRRGGLIAAAVFGVGRRFKGGAAVRLFKSISKNLVFDVGRRSWGGVLLVLSAVTMMGAGSRTAGFALLFALTAATLPVAFRWLRNRWGARRSGVIFLLAGAVGVAVVSVAVTEFWSESTLVQRRTIWRHLWDRITERPFGGYGFFIFWEVPESTATSDVLSRVTSAHSSLVETGIGLGLLGVLPFLLIVVLAASNAFLGLWRYPSADTWMWAAVVAIVLVENVTESFVLWFSYNWVLLLAAALRSPSAWSETEPQPESDHQPQP